MLSIIVTLGDQRPARIRVMNETGNPISTIGQDIAVSGEEILQLSAEDLFKRHFEPAIAVLKNMLADQQPATPQKE